MFFSFILFFFAPILFTDFDNLVVNEKYYIVQMNSPYLGCWEAKLVEKTGNNGTTKWFEYESTDGLTLKDRSPVKNNERFRLAFRTKFAAQLWCCQKCEEDAKIARQIADNMWKDFNNEQKVVCKCPYCSCSSKVPHDCTCTKKKCEDNNCKCGKYKK